MKKQGNEFSTDSLLFVLPEFEVGYMVWHKTIDF